MVFFEPVTNWHHEIILVVEDYKFSIEYQKYQ